MATARARFTDSEVDETIGKTIRILMIANGMTQQTLAEAVGMPGSNLGRRLQGQRQFRPAELKAIAKALGVEVGTLFADPADLLGVRRSAQGLLTSTYRQPRRSQTFFGGLPHRLLVESFWPLDFGAPVVSENGFQTSAMGKAA